MPGKGVGRKRLCPCDACDGAAIDYRAFKKHAEQIAAGARTRAPPYGFGLGDEDPGQAKSSWPPRRKALAATVDIDADQGSVRRDVHAKTVAAAVEVVELVAEGTVTVTGAEALLKLMSKKFNTILEEHGEGSIPRSWYMASKLGLDGKAPKFFNRDFCNGISAGRKKHAEYLFPEDVGHTTCPTCRRYVLTLITRSRNAPNSTYVPGPVFCSYDTVL